MSLRHTNIPSLGQTVQEIIDAVLKLDKQGVRVFFHEIGDKEIFIGKNCKLYEQEYAGNTPLVGEKIEWNHVMNRLASGCMGVYLRYNSKTVPDKELHRARGVEIERT